MQYKICEDNIIRRRVGTKWNPACPNDWFQPLVEKIQNNNKLTPKEDQLYGQCILSLVEIILNNKKFKYQDWDIKSECQSEMLHDILVNMPTNFDKTKGKAYSYAFRIGYVAGIHILEKYNDIREHETNIDDINITNLDIEE